MSELYAVEDGACWFVYHTRQAHSKCCIFAVHALWEHGMSLLWLMCCAAWLTQRSADFFRSSRHSGTHCLVAETMRVRLEVNRWRCHRASHHSSLPTSFWCWKAWNLPSGNLRVISAKITFLWCLNYIIIVMQSPDFVANRFFMKLFKTSGCSLSCVY